MANVQPIYVYPQDCDDFRGTGLCGDLRPVEGTFTEEKNGMSEIVIKVPYEELEKWKNCKPGNIIKAKVPVRIPPAIEDDEYVTSVTVGT